MNKNDEFLVRIWDMGKCEYVPHTNNVKVTPCCKLGLLEIAQAINDGRISTKHPERYRVERFIGVMTSRIPIRHIFENDIARTSSGGIYLIHHYPAYGGWSPMVEHCIKPHRIESIIGNANEHPILLDALTSLPPKTMLDRLKNEGVRHGNRPGNDMG